MPARSERGTTIAYGALVIVAGLNLRDPITSVSAALGAITGDYGLSSVGTAVLSSLPVLMLALGAPLAPLLERRLGPERSVLALALLLAASIALRPLGAPSLYLGTVVAGASISGLSVLTPQLIRERLGAHAGIWSGAFSTSFGVSAAIGAALTLPLTQATGSLTAALSLWAIPALILAVLAALVSRRGAVRRSDGAAPRAGFRVTPLLVQLTVFFGAQALVFFAVTAWLPTVYADRGLPAAQSAGFLAWFSIASLPASLVVSIVAARLERQHLVVLAVSALSATGLAGIAWAPLALAPLFVAVLGFAQGAAFGLAVALIVLKAPAGVPIAPISAFTQGIGYAIAAVGPMVLGLLRSNGVPWSVGIAVLLVVVAVQSIAGWAAGRHAVAHTGSVHVVDSALIGTPDDESYLPAAAPHSAAATHSAAV